MSLNRLSTFGNKAGREVAEKGPKENPCYFCNELFEMGQLQVRGNAVIITLDCTDSRVFEVTTPNSARRIAVSIPA